jgi:hypothetical protein
MPSSQVAVASVHGWQFGPPQSISVSPWFLMPSLQVATTSAIGGSSSSLQEAKAKAPMANADNNSFFISTEFFGFIFEFTVLFNIANKPPNCKSPVTLRLIVCWLNVI